MTLYRGTLCGHRECHQVATHLVRLLLATKPNAALETLITAELCAAHADKAAFIAEVKEAGLIRYVDAFLRAQGQSLNSMRGAVVRVTLKEDGDAPQLPAGHY